MRQWFQAKIGERMLQAGQMAKDRLLLRRGAAKQQDGTLGEPGGAGPMDEEMNIRVGDEVHHHQPTPPATRPIGTLAKLGLAAALLGSGAGIGVAIPLAISALTPQSPAAEAPVDTTNQIEIE